MYQRLDLDETKLALSPLCQFQLCLPPTLSILTVNINQVEIEVAGPLETNQKSCPAKLQRDKGLKIK